MDTRAPELEPSIIVIFGITGDLSKRYLLPALFHLFKEGLLHEKTEIVGISRRDMSLDELFENTNLCNNEDGQVCDPDALVRMRARSRMLKMDVTKQADYAQLLQRLNAIEEEQGVCMNRLYYLSIPPQVYGPIIKLMGAENLNASCQHGRAMTRLLVEKPFGYDLHSAQELIKETGQVFGEEQIYRIDHYLAKETVQDILNFRNENPEFEAVWSKEHIKSIEISASEAIGIEGRADFYEPLGALRDFIQSHLMQLLAVVTMERPETLDSDAIHATKQALLEQVATISSDKVAQEAVRGQYEGYREEVKNPDSITETFAAVRLTIDSDRWRDVPITLWTGKALNEKKASITPHFKNAADELVKQLPDLHSLDSKDHPTPYERVLIQAIRGDHTLFATSTEVLESWRVLQPVISEWSKSDTSLITYKQGTPGSDLLN
ncbi:MAG TPA: glucose-6-phosphate dehydrogenase [Candidatus Saccharimonadales bacterium]